MNRTKMEALSRLPKIDGIHRIPVDTHEPWMIFSQRFSRLPGTVILASGSEADSARYHVLGTRPWLTLTAKADRIDLRIGNETVSMTADPFDVMRHILDAFRLNEEPAFPMFTAGLMGYLAYDLKDRIETLPRTSVDDLHLPDLFLAAHRIVIVEDIHRRQRWACFPKWRFHWPGADPDADLQRLLVELNRPIDPDPGFSGDAGGFVSDFTQETYEAAVSRIREYIAAGDVYQVNLSQRFQMKFEGSPYSLFQALFERNPAPFYAYIHAGDHIIVSTSPERFIRKSGRRVETRPIKGTRPRGKDGQEDERLREALQNSAKDGAELSMIVDLMRNDIGKVCKAGSVRVGEHKRVETYANVHHLVSVVEGKMEEDRDEIDLLRAVFPGGSITGCPKIRAMEIIDELEPVRRHIYTGSIGYIGFDGLMDLSIAIRTATVVRNRIVFSVGGGVVYDSDPTEEFQETLHKGQTLLHVFDGVPSIREPVRWVWFNGILAPEKQAAIPATAPGASYGFGVFETLRIDRHGIRMLQAHIDRLNQAVRSVLASEPPDLTWENILLQVLEANGWNGRQPMAAKIAVWVGEGYPERLDMAVLIRPYVHRLAVIRKEGVSVGIYPEYRMSPLADFKTCNYLYYEHARRWAQSNGYDEALICNPDGSISECATANVLVLRGKEVLIPESPHVLSGIMATHVTKLFRKEGWHIRRAVMDKQTLLDSDGVILTNSLMGPIAALELDGTPLPNPAQICIRLCRRLGIDIEPLHRMSHRSMMTHGVEADTHCRCNEEMP